MRASMTGQWPWLALMLALLSAPALPAANSDEAVWRALIRQSMDLHRKRNFDEAGEMARQAIEFATETFGDTDPKRAASLRQLAYVYSYQRRYSESVPLLQRALSIVELHYGPEHRQVARYLSILANHLSHLGKRQEAELLYERALAMREKLLGPDHLDLAYNLNALARFAVRRGDLQGAEALYKRALEIRRKQLPPDHGWIAESWSFLARLYKKQRRYADAVAAQREAVAVKRAKHGAGHKYVIGYERALAKLEKLAADQGAVVPAAAPAKAPTAAIAERKKRGQRETAATPPKPRVGPPDSAALLQKLLARARQDLGPYLRHVNATTLGFLIAVSVLLVWLSRLARRKPRRRGRAGLEVSREDGSFHPPVEDMNPWRRR